MSVMVGLGLSSLSYRLFILSLVGHRDLYVQEMEFEVPFDFDDRNTKLKCWSIRGMPLPQSVILLGKKKKKKKGKEKKSISADRLHPTIATFSCFCTCWTFSNPIE